MGYQITVLPHKQTIEAASGETLLSALRRAGQIVDAPCGGEGRCGKCKVLVDGKEVLACQTEIDRDMTVTHLSKEQKNILVEGISQSGNISFSDGYGLAFDIGTTTVVGYLLDQKTGQILATESRGNPQIPFGADVISRIRHALDGHLDALTGCIRNCIADIACVLCQKANVLPREIQVMSVVGNPAMQQLFQGILPENLAKVPFSPVLTQAESVPAKSIIPILENAQFLVVPDISGFVGADTLACILATEMENREETSLLVDIGTNGEMVLGNRHGMAACSTAAGPALEGAGIRFGMRAQSGSIDHVWLDNGIIQYSVIGGGNPRGICGSGIIDAVAVSMELGFLNQRGKILTEDGLIHLTENIYLSQGDIRQVQLAKGAVAAGIRLMAEHMGILLEEIQTVYLAGAFGTYLNPKSACRIGLLPQELEERIVIVGNAAGSGAGMLACSEDMLMHAQNVLKKVKALELSVLPQFPRCFAKSMMF